MSLRRQEGEFDILYVSRFEPTSGTDPKQDPANYSRFGLLADLSDEVSNDTQSALDRASSQHESVIYGQQSSSETLTANVQKTDGGGSVTNDPTANSATAGDKSLTISTDSDDEITLSDGDLFTLGSHDYHYKATSSLSLGNSTSGSVDIAPRLQEDIGGGNVVSIRGDAEDPVNLMVRDVAVEQDELWLLIYPEDGSGNAQTGLEGVHVRGALESVENTRNSGEFKQFDASITNEIQPNYFTV